MAIKISGSTIIDDSRQLVNVGVSTFSGDVNVTGVGKSIKIGPADDQLSLEYDSGGLGLIRQNNNLFLLSPTITVGNLDSSKTSAAFSPTGSVELYHNNSKKIETTTNGVTVTGSMCATTLYGDGSNLTGTVFGADAQENLYAGTNAGNGSDADTCFNVALGFCAGYTLNSGDKNVFLGYEAGKLATSGENNIYIGCQAGEQTTEGGNNVFLGHKTGNKTTDGGCGIAMGFYAAACRNSNTGIFIGRYAGHGCAGATGVDNVADTYGSHGWVGVNPP